MNVIIVHGVNKKDQEKLAQGSPPQNKRNWIPWVKKELEKKGINCATPLMPKNWNPIYEEWKKEFEKIDVNEETILIGHSGGGGFVVRWLGETKKKIKKLILIAPAMIYGKEFFHFEKLLKFEINESIREQTNEIIIFVSDDERESFKKSVKIFSEKLSVKPIELKNHGHFTLGDMGTKEFPELLKEVLE